MRKVLWVCSFIIAVLVTGCASRGSGDSVSEAEARDLFAAAVRRTLGADLNGLCDLAATRSLCERDVASDLRARLPKMAPTITCAYRLSDQKDNLGRTVVVGGQVLVVAGTDGAGQPFETEVLVFHDGQRLVAQNIVWWSGMGIAASGPGKPDTTAEQLPDGKGRCDQGTQAENPAEAEVGYLRVLVRSGARGENPPITEAEVAIDEVGIQVKTSDSGYSAAIRLPASTPHTVLASQKLGYYTVTVTKPGFQKHIHHTYVFAGSTESSPTTVDVYLIPGEGEEVVTDSPVGGRTGPQSMGPNK